MQSVLLPQRKQVKTFTAEMAHRLDHLSGVILTFCPGAQQDSVTAEQNDELAAPAAEPRRATQV